jgi:2-methylaconitate cis-trans-isomerase PrpF
MKLNRSPAEYHNLLRRAARVIRIPRAPIPEATGSQGHQKPIKVAYYRGGTSRGLIFQPKDLPPDRTIWPSIFRQIMGSPDPYGRQLDGMGAGISSLSKICLVERMRKKLDPERDGIENSIGIDYTFVGIGIENNEVDIAGNCGNMISAVGPYAYNSGLLSKSVYKRGDGDVTIRIRNTNTQKYIDSTFKVVRGQAAVLGQYAIDGVAGTGAKIKLDFRNPYGSKTGKVLPTGNTMDTIAGYKVTCVDGANPCIFVRADDVGIDGTILPEDFNKLPDKLTLLEDIRKTAAVAMGIAPTKDEVPRTVPKIGIVSMSSTHQVLSGATLKNSQIDLVVRYISDTQPHRASPLTAALTTAVAARIPGTVVEQLLAPDPVDGDALTIGHASGRVQVNATMDETNPLIPVLASVYRTARRILEGEIYWTNENDEEENEYPELDKPQTQTHSLGLAFVEEMRGRDSSYLYDGSLAYDEVVVRKQLTVLSQDITPEQTYISLNTPVSKDGYPYTSSNSNSPMFSAPGPTPQMSQTAILEDTNDTETLPFPVPFVSNRNSTNQRSSGRLKHLRSPPRFLHPSRFAKEKVLPIVGRRVSAAAGESQQVFNLGEPCSNHAQIGESEPHEREVAEKQHAEESQSADIHPKGPAPFSAFHQIVTDEPGLVSILARAEDHKKKADSRVSKRAGKQLQRAQQRIAEYEKALKAGKAAHGDAERLAGLSKRAIKRVAMERRRREVDALVVEEGKSKSTSNQ